MVLSEKLIGALDVESPTEGPFMALDVSDVRIRTLR
jgi:hypothetical protein